MAGTSRPQTRSSPSRVDHLPAAARPAARQTPTTVAASSNASAVEAALRLLLAALIAGCARADPASGIADAPPLLNVAETAEMLKVSRMTIVRLVDERRIPSVIVRRGSSQKIRRIPRAFIERLIAEVDMGAQVDLEQLTAAWLDQLARRDSGNTAATASASGELK
jgi:excisionase family DNA binding protein